VPSFHLGPISSKYARGFFVQTQGETFFGKWHLAFGKQIWLTAHSFGKFQLTSQFLAKFEGECW
jgi:hypothetical protein